MTGQRNDIVLIIVNIDKDENKSLISNQFSLKNDHSLSRVVVPAYPPQNSSPRSVCVCVCVCVGGGGGGDKF